jgi:hypothetical protein
MSKCSRAFNIHSLPLASGCEIHQFCIPRSFKVFPQITLMPFLKLNICGMRHYIWKYIELPVTDSRQVVVFHFRGWIWRLGVGLTTPHRKK